MTESVILNLPLAALAGEVLDLTPDATACRYRLIDCEQLINHDSLRILELPEFPTRSYAAVSYVWRGNSSNNTQEAKDFGTFSVAGAEDGDPIGINVVRHICKASLVQGVGFAWLDRLCIIQTSQEDKGWQISQMFQIYKSCKTCIILPSGIRSLAHLEEETTWIHRGWTLQEAMAPPCAFVLFTWPHGSGMFQNTNFPDVYEVERHTSAIARVEVILQTCRVRVLFVNTQGERESVPIRAKVFGSTVEDGNAIDALTGAMEVTEEEPEEKAYSIWRSSYMRTSSRPVDMVFSIMGLFGVALDPLAFRSQDRLGATIALARELLHKGHSASWLGISFEIAPSKHLAFPEFPTTTVDRRAEVQIDKKWRRVTEVVDGTHWFKDAPKGKMNDDGCLIFSSKAAALRMHTGQQRNADAIQLMARDGTSWEVLPVKTNGRSDEPTKPVEAFAVMVGRRVQYSHGWRSLYNEMHPHTFRALLVKEHMSGRFHIASYIFIADSLEQYVQRWEAREFAIEGSKASQDTRLIEPSCS